MIPRAEISRLAITKSVPEAVIEKDYALTWLLFGVSRDEILSGTLVFKGGTAIRKAYFPEWRYSEDLDFTATRALPFDAVRRLWNSVCKTVTAESGIEFSVVNEKWIVRSDQITGYIGFIGPLGRTARVREIKTDISFDEKIVTPILNLTLYHEYSDPEEPVQLQVYSLEEILSEKFRSLLQRTEPRDLYDIWRILSEPPEDLDLSLLQELVAEKCIQKGIRFEGIDAIIDVNRLNRFSKRWETRLGDQVPDLPEFSQIEREVRRFVRQIKP